ncbi:MAG: hypothetical protein ACD_20C00042G0004 [uncultured bacterium]|nr:MAG: hypothetical protein ACD_20C00042G0004 [uncultured bacterium]
MINTKNQLTLAIEHHQNGNFEKAKSIYNNLLQNFPNDIDILYYYGILCLQVSELDKALELLNKVIELNPEDQLYKNVLILTGDIYMNKQDFHQAKNYYLFSIEIDNQDFVPYFNLGVVYHNIKEFCKAVEYYNLALKINPELAECYKKLISIYSQNAEIDKVIDCYLSLIKLQPDEASHYFNIAIEYSKKRDLDNSHRAYLNAVYLNPNFVEAYVNLGDLYFRTFNFNQALECLQKAYRINPDIVECLNNLTNVYLELRKPDKAIELCLEGLRKFPDNNFLSQNLARAQFLIGDIDNGWEYFKYRRISNENKNFKSYLLDYKGSLKDKKILVYHDSGFGDTIQFSRYLPLLGNTGAKVICKVQSQLVSLLQSNNNLKTEIISKSETIKDTDYDMSINLTTLAYLFKTDINQIPLKKRYIFPISEKVVQYKEKYFNNNDYKIGIVWKALTHPSKNISDISLFFPLAKSSKIKLYSLQKEGTEEFQDKMPSDIKLIDIGSSFRDFSDTAAAIENLDLIITADTAIAHLAGAMGKQTLVLLPYSPNWRWFLDRQDCPWYDSIKLLRQKEPGNWFSVFEEIYNILKEKAFCTNMKL